MDEKVRCDCVLCNPLCFIGWKKFLLFKELIQQQDMPVFFFNYFFKLAKGRFIVNEGGKQFVEDDRILFKLFGSFI